MTDSKVRIETVHPADPVRIEREDEDTLYLYIGEGQGQTRYAELTPLQATKIARHLLIEAGGDS